MGAVLYIMNKLTMKWEQVEEKEAILAKPGPNILLLSGPKVSSICLHTPIPLLYEEI